MNTCRNRLSAIFVVITTMPLMFGGSVSHAQIEMVFSGSSPDEKPPMFIGVDAPIPANASDMQTVLDAQQLLDVKPIETLTPAAARRQPTLYDGVKVVMKQKNMPAIPEGAVSTFDFGYGSNVEEMLRIYTADVTKNMKKLPIIVYYPGGGWVINDLKAYDAMPRFLAIQLNVIVVLVDYRHAPEAKFPAQHEDAALAYRWVLKNAHFWGGDPSHVALAGEGAGGNLAVATAIYARDHALRSPVHILSVYPIANSDMALPSKLENLYTKPLNTPMLSWFAHYYASSLADTRDPRVNLVAADLHGLPPTTIINAQNDPLLSDGETLAAAMRKAGDRVEQRTYAGVTHDFFGMGEVVVSAHDAETYAAQRLKLALFPYLRAVLTS